MRRHYCAGGGSVLIVPRDQYCSRPNGGHILIGLKGSIKLPRPGPPLICIPTTSGASADIPVCIINNTEKHYKIAIIGKKVRCPTLRCRPGNNDDDAQLFDSLYRNRRVDTR